MTCWRVEASTHMEWTKFAWSISISTLLLSYESYEAILCYSKDFCLWVFAKSKHSLTIGWGLPFSFVLLIWFIRFLIQDFWTPPPSNADNESISFISKEYNAEVYYHLVIFYDLQYAETYMEQNYVLHTPVWLSHAGYFKILNIFHNIICLIRRQLFDVRQQWNHWREHSRVNTTEINDVIWIRV